MGKSVKGGKAEKRREKGKGFHMPGVLADSKEQLIMSFMSTCARNLPFDLLQLSPCIPVMSTTVPQMHW